MFFTLTNTKKNHRKTAGEQIGSELTTFQPFPLERKTDSGALTSNRKSHITSPSNENEDRLQNLKSDLEQCKRKFGDMRTKIQKLVVDGHVENKRRIPQMKLQRSYRVFY